MEPYVRLDAEEEGEEGASDLWCDDVTCDVTCDATRDTKAETDETGGGEKGEKGRGRKEEGGANEGKGFGERHQTPPLPPSPAPTPLVLQRLLRLADKA